MKIDRSIAMDPDEALARLRALTDYWSAKYGVSASWDGFAGRVSGKVRGVKFDGHMRLEGGRLTADIQAGFLAEKLGGKKYVEGKIDDYLSPARTLDELRARVPR
jgi:hypothetical protein